MTNWKRIQSVKQEGKWIVRGFKVWSKTENEVEFGKKWARDILKIGNFLLKYLFGKKITSRLTPSTWQCMYIMCLEVGAFVDKKKFVD